MVKSRRQISGCVCGLLVWAALQVDVCAQLPTADLSYLQPRAARAGETVEVNLSGTNLEDLTELRFTHAGITAKPVMLPADEFFPVPRMNGLKFSVTVAQPSVMSVRTRSGTPQL